MKICILTHSLHTNYGGLLQAFALQKVLRDMGHDVVTAKESANTPMSALFKLQYFCRHLVMRYILCKKLYNPFRYLFMSLNHETILTAKMAVNTDRFICQHIKYIDFFKGGIAPDASVLNQFEALVVGSDQVWRPAYVYTPAYFLDFTKSMKIKRVAYAASFGVDTINEFKSNVLKKCKDSVLLFDAISVREDSGIKLCKDHLDVDAVHLLDPTMLLNKEDYLEVIEEQDKVERNAILMCYVLDKSPEKIAIIKRVAQDLKLTELNVMPKVKYPAPTSNENDWVYPSVSKWLAGFRDAKFIVTDSFHGTVFSIIFNKPFIAINNAARGSSRFTSLLKMFGLEDRLISSINDLTPQLLDNINYIKVNNIRKDWKNKSFDFLNTNIN